MNRCAAAIIDCDALAYQFPQTIEEVTTAANIFKTISTIGFMVGCIGVMDGDQSTILQQGGKCLLIFWHYNAYVVNIQAACDHKCRIIEVCIAAPGGHNDIAAFRKCTLPNLISNLPGGYYVIGDNTYVCSENLLTVYSGYSRNDPTNDTFNFYLSQLRIRIEMAVDLLKTEWRILRSLLQLKAANVGVLFVAIT
jgi:DDE superfamily endonuclease